MNLLLSLLMVIHPVTVKSGDTLWGLFQTRWVAVAQYNHLQNPNLIYPGQILQVPAEGWKPSAVYEGSDTINHPAPVAVARPDHIYSAPPSSQGWSGPWKCIAQGESGGNPTDNTGNGYYGGLQFSLSTWQAEAPKVGVKASNPIYASIAQQEAVANQTLADSSWGLQWPATSRACGYR